MVDILYAVRRDRKRIIELSDQYIGANYLKEEHFEKEHEVFLVAIEGFKTSPQGSPEIVEPQNIVGFASCVISRGFGNINTVVVEPGHRRKGIGSKLVHACLVHMWNLGVKRVTCQAWERSDNGLVAMRGPLKANGFEELEYEPDYYSIEDSDELCIVCGNICKCGAFVFSLEMSDARPPEIPAEVT